ncbi:MAG: ABC transporter ATP-binding protein [Saccharolobus sp.]|uniref:ABC transporter ATP-binding protein n=1 Tax=Saccharolobus sp. TaxID=2100761 RepID=UPI00316232D6
MSSIIISVRDLVVNYYTFGGVIKALREVDLDINHGESICIVGESGSGKSTLVQAIAMILPQNAVIERGSIIYDGIDISRNNSLDVISKVRREIGMVFQDPATSFSPLFPIKQQFVDVLSEVLKVTPEEALMISEEALKNVRLIEVERVLNSYPHELSGGMLQRAALALALAKKPKVLIADEPTTNLDVTTQAEILELIKMLKQKHGLTLIMVTHNFGVAAQVCDRVVVMYAGMIFEEGPTRQVLSDPLHPYTRGLLTAVPRIGRLSTPIPGFLPDPREDFKGCPFYSRCSNAREECSTQKPSRVVLRERRVFCHLYGGS